MQSTVSLVLGVTIRIIELRLELVLGLVTLSGLPLNDLNNRKLN